jgi:hypothetical protein
MKKRVIILGVVGAFVLATAGMLAQTRVNLRVQAFPVYRTSRGVLAFPLIPAGACASDQTFSLPGADLEDTVIPGWPSGFEDGLSGAMRVTSSGTIAVRVCADVTASVHPATATFTATVFH